MVGNDRPGYVVGLDEAGRGALAGPLASACVVFDRPVDQYSSIGIRDSKVLAPRKRESLFRWILENARGVSVGWASVTEIDRLNVRVATLLAMGRAVENLLGFIDPPSIALVAVDGIEPLPDFPFPQRTVIGGDGSVLTIAAASIVAKVSRDRVMDDLDRDNPLYFFREHKGYGTLAHRDAIREHGLSPHHRPLFCRKVLNS